MSVMEKLQLMEKIRETNNQRLIAAGLMKNGGNKYDE